MLLQLLNLRLKMKGLKYMDNKNIAKEWFVYADFDLKSAVFLLKMKPKP